MVDQAWSVEHRSGHSSAELRAGRGRPRVLAEAHCGPGLSPALLGEAGGEREAEVVVTEGLGAQSEERGRR